MRRLEIPQCYRGAAETPTAGRRRGIRLPPAGKRPEPGAKTPDLSRFRILAFAYDCRIFPTRPLPPFLLAAIVIPGLIDSLADITSHRDRDDVDRAIVAMLYSHVRPGRVCLYRLLPAGAEGTAESRGVQLRAVADAAGARTVAEDDAVDPRGWPTVGSRVPWRECVRRGDMVHYLADDDADEPGSRNTVFPVVADHGLIGLLEIECAGRCRFLRPDDARMVQAVLRILRNHLSVLDYGERDTLTGLRNRRTFETMFAKRRIFRRRAGDQRAGTRTNWVGIIDVDHFKAINDTFGHLFGDEVLLLIARRMQETFRQSEALFRFGGEEFLVILDDADEAGAMKAFERFRTAIAQHRFPQIGQVTVSVGVTRIGSYDIPASAIDRADSALYFAKEHGRNRTLAYEALLREGLLARKAVQAAELELF